jgi:hypothetical protein
MWLRSGRLAATTAGNTMPAPSAASAEAVSTSGVGDEPTTGTAARAAVTRVDGDRHDGRVQDQVEDRFDQDHLHHEAVSV